MPDCPALNVILQVRSKWVVCLALLTACDPTFSISGHTSGSGARVFLECPDARVTREVVADLDGRFVFGGVGCLAKKCRVRSGEASVELGAACAHTAWVCSSDKCTAAKVELGAR
jgi:hypothetical protein